MAMVTVSQVLVDSLSVTASLDGLGRSASVGLATGTRQGGDGGDDEVGGCDG